jgi:hypothetical protein
VVRDFVSWCLHKAQVPDAFAATRVTLFAGHYAGRNRFVKRPRTGDLVCYDWGMDGRYDHMGIVEDVLPDGRLQTIEGNTNPGNGQDGVYRLRRSTANARGYCRPAYREEGRTYTVQAGDTLSGIATAHGTTVDALMALNPQIENRDLIHPGDRILLG